MERDYKHYYYIIRGKVKHKYVAYGLAVMAALFSLTGALNYVLVFVSALSVLLAPMPGLYIAEIYIVKSNSERYAWNIWGLAAWVIAGITGYYCNLHSILIPPVVSGIVAFCVYVAVGKIFLKDRGVKTEVPG